MSTTDSRETLRFRDFELDLAAYQLRRNGHPVRLERQPMDLLILLVERRSQLLSHSDIVDRLWGKEVFVDVETGVHTAIRKVRQALGDSAEAPTCVESVNPVRPFFVYLSIPVASYLIVSGGSRTLRML